MEKIKLAIIIVFLLIVSLGRQASAGIIINKAPVYLGLTHGLVGHWTFDGSDISGTRAKDRSGLNNHGTLTSGPTVVSGKIGQALQFDGVDDDVRVTDSNSISLGNQNLSFSIWAYNTNRNLFEAPAVFGKTNGADYDYTLRISNNGISDAQYSVFQDADITPATGTGPKWNEWQHLAVVKNGTTVSVYADGVFSGSGTVTNTDSNGDIYIGSLAGGNYFKGQIDDVRLYNRALSAGEVQRLYNQGR